MKGQKQKTEEYVKQQCDCEKLLRGNFGSIHTFKFWDTAKTLTRNPHEHKNHTFHPSFPTTHLCLTFFYLFIFHAPFLASTFLILIFYASKIPSYYLSLHTHQPHFTHFALPAINYLSYKL